MSDADRWLPGMVIALLAAARSAHADAPRPTAISTQARVTVQAAGASEALFAEGRRLATEGRYPEACVKLEQSLRLDAAAGTQINLADCYEHVGKMASAWLAFHEAAALAQQTGRDAWAAQAGERARSLEARVPTLALVVDEPVPGLEVRRDGLPVERATLGAPVPVDPGVYTIVAVAPRRAAWSTRVALEASAHVVLHIPALPEGTPPPRKEEPAASRSIAADPRARATGTAQRTAGLFTAAAGVVPLGIGAYFGVLAITRNAQAVALCPASPRCTDAHAVTLTDDARKAAAASTVAFGTAGVLLAAGTSLFLAAPRTGTAKSVAIEVGVAAVSLRGRW